MEKEFIPYKQAVALKELEFDEPCLARYLILTFWERVTGEIKLQMTDCTINEEYLIKAPLYQQAFRWFREKYNLHCNIDPWGYCIFDDNGTEKTGFETYEQSQLECLKKLIEIVK